MAMIFVGPATHLADIDLPRIGSQIGVGEDEMHAVIDVEASGSGYDSQHRPKMLFEPHHFYANLSGQNRAAAVRQRLACVHWGDLGSYPAESYTRLSAAMAIDLTAALRSASWGMGQIMGENHVAAGYDTVEAMVQAFVDLGEAEQLSAMVRFIKYNHLDDELKAHNWAAFARGFNGPSYAKNAYDVKLATAYARWSKIRDTPWTLGTTQTIGQAVPIAKTLAIALAKAPDDRVAIGPAAGMAAPATPSDVKIIVVPAPKPPDPSKPAAITTPPQPAPSAGFSLSGLLGRILGKNKA